MEPDIGYDKPIDYAYLSYSTTSSALNSMSLVALEDIIKKKTTLSDSDAAKISKILGEQYSEASRNTPSHLVLLKLR